MTVYIVKAYFGDYDGNWSRTIYSTLVKEDAEYIVSTLNPIYQELGELEASVTELSMKYCYLPEEDRDYYSDSVYRLQQKLKDFSNFSGIAIEEIEIGHFNPLVI